MATLAADAPRGGAGGCAGSANGLVGGRGVHGWLWADQIHFSQTSIKATFQNGGSLEHLEAELRRDGRAILGIGHLNVVLHLGKWFTRDNRRLYAIKRVAPDCLVPVAFGTVDRLFLSHFTTQNGGSSIYVRGARAARFLCRTSFHPPHMGLACDGGGLPARPPKGSIAQFILARVCSKRVWGGSPAVGRQVLSPPQGDDTRLPRAHGHRSRAILARIDRGRASPSLGDTRLPRAHGHRSRAILALIDRGRASPSLGEARRWRSSDLPRVRKHRGKRGGQRRGARRPRWRHGRRP